LATPEFICRAYGGEVSRIFSGCPRRELLYLLGACEKKFVNVYFACENAFL
jgi:hypothetical protein